MKRFAAIAAFFIFGVIMVLCAGARGENKISSSDFTDPDTCAGCHPAKFDAWKNSPHARADSDPIYRAMFLKAGADTKGLTDAFCSRCHTPIGNLSGEIPPIDGSKLSPIARRGIQCDFCHTVSGSKKIGDAGFVSSPGEIKRGPFKDAKSSFHKTAFSELHTQSDFCGMCHNVSHPVNGLPLEETYTEWKESPYAAEGVACQNCHMTSGAPPQPAPGKSALDGPDRPETWLHTFIGPNVFLPAFYGGDPAREQLSRELLSRAAAVRIGEFTPGPYRASIKFDVFITNTGAGHKIPTGLTEVREVWLEVRAEDADGMPLVRSGILDPKGNITGDPLMFHVVVADAEEKPTTDFWKAVKVVSDRRIAPRATVRTPYEIPLIPGARSPIKVTATLKYRSISQSKADELLGKDGKPVPVIDMAVATATTSVP